MFFNSIWLIMAKKAKIFGYPSPFDSSRWYFIAVPLRYTA